jgi:hypothetical protein
MRTVLVIVSFLAACGGASKPGEVGGKDPKRTAAVPCPADESLALVAAPAWAPAEDVRDLWCAALRAGDDTMWWIGGYASDPNADGASPHQLLAMPDGNVLWRNADPYDDYQPQVSDAVAIDLDVDGTDELLYVETAGEGGYSSSALVVVGIAGGAPKSGRADLGFSSIDAEGCLAEWKVDDGGVIAITGDGECATFSGRFRWDGATLLTE